MSKNQARKPLEIKISTVVAVAALLGDTDHGKLSSALAQITAGTPDYFEDEFTLLDFAQISPLPAPGPPGFLKDGAQSGQYQRPFGGCPSGMPTQP
jgi:hypothetical protein